MGWLKNHLLFVAFILILSLLGFSIGSPLVVLFVLFVLIIVWIWKATSKSNNKKVIVKNKPTKKKAFPSEYGLIGKNNKKGK